MKEARAVAGRGGDVELARDGLADSGDDLVALRRRGDVLGERDVVARLRGGEQRRDSVGGVRDRDEVGIVQLAARLVLLEQALGVVLRLLHVRLVEGVDAEERAGDRGGEFPREEDLAEVLGVVQDEIDDGMAGVGQLLQLGDVVGAAQADADEDAVLAVVGRFQQRLAGDWEDALPLLAGRLGDELLDPEAERVQRRRRDEGELVAAVQGHGGEDRAEHRRRVLLRRGKLRHVARMHGAVEQRVHVDARERRRHHAEVRQRGVAAADIRHVDEDLMEPVALRVFDQLRAGIGDGDEALAGAIAFDRLHAVVEVAVEHHRLGGRAGFRGDDEEGALQVERLLEVAHGLGDGGVEDLEPRIAGPVAEDAPRDLGAQARAAHAEDHDVVEVALDGLGEGAQLRDLLLHQLRHGEPAEGVGDDLLVRVVVLPERRVFLPDAIDELLFLDALRGLIDRCLCTAEVEGKALAESVNRFVAARFDRRHQRRERFVERLHAILGELGRDRVETETLLVELAQHLARGIEVLLQRHGNAAVLLERFVGRRRNCVDGVRPDERLDVEHVAVRRILRAGRCPQRTLHIRAVMLQLLPTLAAEGLFEELVGELGVGNRDLAEERADLGIIVLLQLRFHLLLGQRVDAANEKAGDRCDLVRLDRGERPGAVGGIERRELTQSSRGLERGDGWPTEVPVWRASQWAAVRSPWSRQTLDSDTRLAASDLSAPKSRSPRTATSTNRLPSTLRIPSTRSPRSGRRNSPPGARARLSTRSSRAPRTSSPTRSRSGASAGKGS